ncbi:hypothetical protein ACKVMT_11945 [Halobacteriales archaeon Cl-PHB]
MELDDLTTGEKVALGGGVAAVVGAVLPWASFMGQSVSGLDGDGVITLILGIAAAGVIVVREWGQMDQAGVGVLGLLTLAIGGMAYSDIGSLASMGGSGSGFSISISPGIGLYLTLLAGILMLAGAALGYSNSQGTGQSTSQLGD